MMHQPSWYQNDGIQGSFSNSFEGHLLMRGDDDSATSVEEDPLFNASGALQEFALPPGNIGKLPLLRPTMHNESDQNKIEEDLDRAATPS